MARKPRTTVKQGNKVIKLMAYAKERGIKMTYYQATEWHMKYQSEAYTKLDLLIEIYSADKYRKHTIT